VYHASKVGEIYKEAQAMKKFDHPNIVKLYHALLWKNFVVLIMEYVPGGELTEYLKQTAELSEFEAKIFFSQLTDAICYCFNKFVIHRDLKPENVLLTDNISKNIKVILLILIN